MFENEKIVEIKTCKHCSSSFEITDKDLEFYEKVSPVFAGKKYNITSPTLCPDCRQQRRQSFKNIYHLYKNPETGIISPISPDKGYNVILQKDWWENDKLGLEFGKDFDFSKSFFSHFLELQKIAPRWNLIQVNSENCERCVNMANSKNCYYIKSGGNSENCYYGERIFDSKNIIDGYRVDKSENCYDIFYVQNCFGVYFGKDIKNSNNCFFVQDCENISHCIGCIGLNNKEYFILNKKVSKKEFELQKAKVFTSKEFLKDFLKQFNILIKKVPVKNINLRQTENSYGNDIFNSKNIKYGFSIQDCENAKYIFDGYRGSSMMDINGDDDGNLNYECSSNYAQYGSAFCFNTANLTNCFYCETSVNLTNCFGCVGLNNKSYCILNKQYTKEEYKELIPKIIEHMQKTGEWGEFFPSSISPYGYNESEAIEYFTLEKEQAQKENFKWSNYEPPFPKVDKIIPANKLPKDVSKIPDDILNWAIECEITKKPFRIISQELDFYRKHNLPIPRRHPDQRHLDRIALRNPRKLFDRKCDKCGKNIKTTYSPDRKEIVYCEECYNKEIY